jgi:hypothetical protein
MLPMNRCTKFLSAAFACSSFALLLVWPRASLAADCVTDMDCPGTACGDQVCQWVSSTSHVCQAAGSKSRGSDGWCNTTADCKCQSVGAKCNAQFSCSFVLAADAPAGGGAGGTANGGAAGAALGGASGASGGIGGGSASGADSSGGAPANGGALASGGDTATSAGTSSVAGAAQTMPDGPITGSPSGADAGGCRIGGVPTRADALFGLGLLGTALLGLRRRRSA